MKKLTIIISIMLLGGFIQAQSIERSVIASTGYSYSGATLQVDYTIGESIIATASNAGSILTQGFQQPDFMLTGIEENPRNGMDITYYPNPCIDVLNIRINNPKDKSYVVDLYNIEGKKIMSRQMPAPAVPGTAFTLDVSPLATGVYYLRLATDKEKISGCSIIKINY